MSADEQDLIQLGLTPQQALHVADRGGWTPLNVALSYASATAVTIPAGEATKTNLTGRITVGTKLKFDNSTTKYFYVTAVTSTQITVSGGSDYTVANSAITNAWYSNVSSPVGFPGRFNYTPAWGASVAAPTLGDGAIVGSFGMSGRRVHLFGQLTIGSTTAGGTGFWKFGIPIGTIIAIVNFSAFFSRGVANHIGISGWGSDTEIVGYLLQTGATPLAIGLLSATYPFAMAAGNIHQFTFEYGI